MGSGISLTYPQIVSIIKRDLKFDFENHQRILPRYTDDGYEIFYDYSDEVKLNNTIQKIDYYLKYGEYK